MLRVLQGCAERDAFCLRPRSNFFSFRSHFHSFSLVGKNDNAGRLLIFLRAPHNLRWAGSVTRVQTMDGSGTQDFPLASTVENVAVACSASRTDASDSYQRQKWQEHADKNKMKGHRGRASEKVDCGVAGIFFPTYRRVSQGHVQPVLHVGGEYGSAENQYGRRAGRGRVDHG